MKILMTNDEWNQAGWFHRFVAIIAGNIVLFLVLGSLVLLFLFVIYGLTAVSIKIYLAAIVVILLIVVFRKRSKAS
jgi:ABC-type uncharacterized transport system permease subunit